MRIFSLLLIVLCTAAPPAAACSPTVEALNRSAEEQLALAPTAFLGTVETIENGAVYIRVEKSIKGVADGELFETQQGRSSCDIRFQPGQRWLYVGSDVLSGSRLITDEYGRSVSQNQALVEESFGTDPTAGKSPVGGTITESCAPWDGPAVSITLDNHIKIAVFTALESMEKQYGVVSYRATPEMMHESGGAAIALCDETGGNCRIGYGTVSIGSLDADGASGRVDIVDIKVDEEHATTHVFHVKRIVSKPLCG